MSRTKDAFLVWVLRFSAVAAGALVVLIFGFLLLESVPALHQVGVGRFFTDASWHPSPDAAAGFYNLTPMLWGTLFVTAGAVVLAAPLGILSAVFSHDVAPPALARFYRGLIELLAGIPSVVYGFWGLVVLVPLIRRIEPPGPSLLAGILILAIMVLPTMALGVDAAFSQVPPAYRHGAAALGLSRWTTLRGVIFPSIRSSLLTGLLLQTGRAIGETMAILMVCGNIVQTPQSLFDPFRTLTANIALEMAYALGDHRSALFVSGLLLLVLIAALVAAADTVGRGRLHAG